MKKLLALVALLAFPIALIGCGNKEPEINLDGLESEAMGEETITPEETRTIEETINEVEGIIDELEGTGDPVENGTVSPEDIEDGEIAPTLEVIVE